MSWATATCYGCRKPIGGGRSVFAQGYGVEYHDDPRCEELANQRVTSDRTNAVASKLDRALASAGWKRADTIAFVLAWVVLDRGLEDFLAKPGSGERSTDAFNRALVANGVPSVFDADHHRRKRGEEARRALFDWAKRVGSAD